MFSVLKEPGSHTLRTRLLPWMQSEAIKAALILAVLLNAIFFAPLWGDKTLLMSVWDAPSVTPSGAYRKDPATPRVHRSSDAVAAAWQSEPWFKVISDQFRKEGQALPLWNPFAAYGTPLAGAMQPQPFYPLTALLSLNPTPWTYSIYIVGRLFVAGFLMFLFARLFLGFTPSLFAAIAFMLNGYFIQFYAMPHLSVEVLIPGILFTFERLLRRGSWEAATGAAVMIFLSVVGGMPESLFLAVSFACLYYCFRLLVTPQLRENALSLVAKLITAVTLGFGLSAFVLLPFFELMLISHDAHQPGNLGGHLSGREFDEDVSRTVTYLLPLIFGPASNSILSNFAGHTGMRGYWGILPALFAVVAVLYWAARRQARLLPHPATNLTVFFAVCLGAMLLKRFGHPVIHWMGSLPIANMIIYPKYQEPLMALCVAFLAGVGVECVLRDRSKVPFIAGAAIITCVMLSLAGWSLPQVLQLQTRAFVYYLTVLAGVVLILGTVLLFILCRSLNVPRLLAWSVVACLAAELSLNYIIPTHYLFNTLPSARNNPYNGAPYVNFLRSHNKNYDRVFALHGILHPNWAGAFQLSDPRSLDGIFVRRYLQFVRSFFLKPDEKQHGDMINRFTGYDFPYRFETDSARRFLSLSSIKYLMSAARIEFPASDKNEAQRYFREEYHNEVVVYEYAQPLPRAALFVAVEVLHDAQVLSRLNDPAYKLQEKALLSQESLTGIDANIVRALTRTTPVRASSARIVHYESQRVRIVAETSAAALLVLNDTNYPGWRAKVNGTYVPVVKANYLFRGVFLSPGTSVVEFLYEPVSFRLGVFIALGSLMILLGARLVRVATRNDQGGVAGGWSGRGRWY